jgi:hypothetical protein
VPALAELQRRMAAALLADPDALPPGLLRAGPIPARAALAVHRDTILGGLVQALRLSCPTVDRIVGEAFFDHAAAAFASAVPPSRPDLDAYGDGFAAFLARHEPATPWPYLADVARFDRALERAGAASMSGRGRTAPLGGASLVLAASLAVLELDYPADAIRAAIEDGHDIAVALIEPAPHARALAIWRAEAGVMGREISPASGVFLARLLEGADAGDAFDLALAAEPDADVPALLQAEVFAAPFSTVVPDPDLGASPCPT